MKARVNYDAVPGSSTVEDTSLPKGIKFSKWVDIDHFVSESPDKAELEAYQMFRTDHVSDKGLLQWWEKNTTRFPLMSHVARKVLCVPAASSASERNFSAAGFVLCGRRQQLSPDLVDCTLFLHDNL